ncbi:MAG: glutamate-5-semialdehyde dehydrogenase [Firmicutes bacterium]|nr:glutamate-5-semialdehyde dehydrogenase [Bacillota bacterium]
MDIKNYMLNMGTKAKKASKKMSTIDTNTKNKALELMSKALLENKEKIISANKKDMDNGKKNNLSKAKLDRLLLDEKRINSMANGLKKISNLPDPVGEGIKTIKRPNNLIINKIRVPLGVLGIIYESRPNVTVDAVGLCIKSGNTVILRGGSEAIHSNKILTDIIYKASLKAGLPENSIQLVETTDREAVKFMMQLNDYIDVLIPRGGKGLIQAVVNNSTVPVIETGVGNCHIFIDDTADFNMAEKIIINAKTQRPAVCNTMETLLVHKDIKDKFLPIIKRSLTDLGVELVGCEKTKDIIDVDKATEKDWANEYLDLKLAIKVVDSIDEAIDHIYEYGTKHSESIITNNYENSQKFHKEIDAAAVYVNASTRFTDGERYGLGAEIGISTQKLHARGPMGLKELTTVKYTVFGDGQIS